MTRIVENPGDSFEWALKRFQRKEQEAGILSEAQQQSHCENPQARRKRQAEIGHCRRRRTRGFRTAASWAPCKVMRDRGSFHVRGAKRASLDEEVFFETASVHVSSKEHNGPQLLFPGATLVLIFSANTAVREASL